MTRLAVCAYVYGAYGGSCRFSAPHSLLIDGSVYCFVAGGDFGGVVPRRSKMTCCPIREGWDRRVGEKKDWILNPPLISLNFEFYWSHLLIAEHPSNSRQFLYLEINCQR